MKWCPRSPTQTYRATYHWFVFVLCQIRAETERGLSRKHIIEGIHTHTHMQRTKQQLQTFRFSLPQFVIVSIQSLSTTSTFASLRPPGLKGSLQRMQLEYVDVVFANRPDSNTPMEGESANQHLTLSLVMLLSI